MVEQVVAFELEKTLCQPALLSQNLAHRHLRVVIGDPFGHPPEKLERTHMPFPKRLRAFALERHHKRRVAVRQAHHEERHLAQPAIHIGQRMAEVHLRLAGTMQQRHKHLLVLLRQLPHRVLDHRVTAREASFPQAFPDSFGRVPLLARQRLILFQNLFDPFQKSPQLLLGTRLLLPVTRRLTVCQNLLQRQPVQLRLPKYLTFTHTLHQHSPANLAPVFHIAIHASWLMKLPHF
jgi:hypothetical protein